MSECTSKQDKVAVIADPRWKDLYRIGAFACIVFPVSIVIAILVFFIWPYAPGSTSVADTFAILQTSRMAGLMALEVQVIVLLAVMVLQLLAVYAALQRVNASYALIALVFGLMGVVLWLTARPVVEMAHLSDQYTAATTDVARRQYLAAGEAFYALFDGTAWMVSQFFIGISGMISSLLMVRSRAFSKATAYTGIGLSIVGFGFWIPAVGVVLSLLGTMGGVIWYGLMARDFFRLAWRRQGQITSSAERTDS